MGRRGKAVRRRREAGKTPAVYWLALIIGVGAFLPYAGTLGHELVFDDVTLIVQNPLVTGGDVLGIVLESGYRPVRTLTYALNYALGGEDPFGYHLFNVLLHSFNAALLFLLLRRLTGFTGACAAAALLYAVHPVQTAAVAYVSGRKDLMAALFMLSSLLLYLRFRRVERKRYWSLAGAALCFLLAVLSKEVAIVFPGLLLVIDAFRETESVLAERKARLPIHLAAWRAVRNSPLLYGIFSILAFLGLFYALFVAKASRMEGFWGGSFWTNLGTSFKLFAHYVELALFPHRLLADYLGDVFPVSTGLTEPSTLGAILFLLLYVALAAWLFTRAPLVSVGMFWFLAAVAPVLQLVPFHELAADHFLYVPLIGLSMAFTVAVQALHRLFPSAVVWCLAALLLTVFVVRTVERNGDWKNKQTLWEATYQTAPGSYRANANLGQIYFNQGRYEDGIMFTRRSTELAPDRALPYGNLGAMYYTVAQRERSKSSLDTAEELQFQAQAQLNRALELEPDNPFTLSNLGNTFKELALIHEDRGRIEQARLARQEAEAIYRKALAVPDMRMDSRRIWFNLGLLMVDAGRFEAGLDYLRRYVSVFPNDGNGNYWLALCHYRLGKYERAIPLFKTALQARQTPEVWLRLGESCEHAGRLSEAAQAYQQLANQSPTAENFYNWGRVLARLGDSGNARSALNRAVQIDSGGLVGARSRELLQTLAP